MAPQAKGAVSRGVAFSRRVVPIKVLLWRRKLRIRHQNGEIEDLPIRNVRNFRKVLREAIDRRQCIDLELFYMHFEGEEKTIYEMLGFSETKEGEK